ncbi:MAG: hypothetical protein LBR16_03150 [Treponema sp.]|jgi:hypothetical protein|nr:hypothetical protein [Treponema sp.]
MKKCVLLPVLLLPASLAFGLNLTGGGGVSASSLATRYSLDVDGFVSTEITQDLDQLNCGVSVFLDAIFAEAALTLQTGSNKYRERLFGGSMEEAGTGRETALCVSLLGKHPIAVAKKITIFPLVGLEYQIVLGEWRAPEGTSSYNRTDGRETDKDGKRLQLSDWNAFFVQLGGGADYAMGERFFLRGEALYGIRLMTGYERKSLELTKKQFGDNDPDTGGLSSALLLRISLGYKPRRNV